jgi:hypothetical protein
MGYFNKDNVFIDGLVYFLISSGVLLTLVLIASLYGTNFGTYYTDFACAHSIEGVECNLVKHTRSLRLTEIKIHNPVGVDINTCEIKDIFGKHYYDPDCYGSSSAEIRSKGVSYKIKIYGGLDSHKVNAIAREINEFLISSNTPSFYKRF